MKKNIKVLHVIAGLGNGGAERQLIELVKNNQGHGVVLLSDAGVYKETLENFDIKYWELGVQSKLLVFNKIFIFKNIIYKFEPDIIQAWMYNACFFSSICKVIKLYSKPLIWSIRCSDMVTKHYSSSLKFIILFCKVLSKIADKIIYNSFAGMSYHREIGFSKNNTEVIFNGVESKRFKPILDIRKKLRNKYNFHSNDLVLLCVARVDPMKNHNNLLNAFKNIKNNNKYKIKLLLIGKDTEKLYTPNDCIALGMKINIEKYYNIADVILLPSSFGEGFSNVLVEGMLTNLLPVATDIGDAKKIIGNTGYIIEDASQNMIKNKLLEIAKLKKSMVKDLGLKARIKACKTFSVDKMINSYNHIYKKVIS